MERTGIVGDVIFDLRHPTLDSVSWTVESLLRTQEDRRRYPNRPYLWFPWYGPYTEEFAQSNAKIYAKKQKQSHINRPLTDIQFIPEYIIDPGDKISISPMENIDNLGDIKMRDVICADSVALARLNIKRSDDTIIIVDTPIRFFSRRIASTYVDVNAIARRIRLTIENYENKNEIFRICNDAENVAHTIISLINAVKDEYKTLDLGNNLEHIVSMSVLLGQLLAKAETATSLEPLADAQREFQEKTRAAGVKSGQSRRNAPWRPIAQEFAIQTREKNPDWSQDKIAGEIIALWKDDDPPTHGTLKDFISELEHRDVLLRRVTRKQLSLPASDSAKSHQ